MTNIGSDGGQEVPHLHFHIFAGEKIGISDLVKGGGYRSLVNAGENGGQEVPHLHFHIFGGEKIGKMVS